MRGGGALRLLLHRPEVLHQLVAKGRQAGAAATDAAELGAHRRLAEALVDAVDQLPGPAVGHPHLAAGGRDRAQPVDALEQGDLARPDRAAGIEVDAQTQLRHAAMIAQPRPTSEGRGSAPQSATVSVWS